MPYLQPKKPEVCKVCGVRTDNHPSCPSCGICIGKNHIEKELVEYQGKRMCRSCKKAEIKFPVPSVKPKAGRRGRKQYMRYK